MKGSAIFLSLALASILSARADVTITWNSYSSDGFDVLISGNGLVATPGGAFGGWSGSTTSPNGLWSLDTQNIFRLYTPFPGTVEISNTGHMTNNATVLGYLNPLERTQGYSDVKSYATLPVSDGTAWNVSYTSPFLLWTGYNTIQITSMPNVNDPSTWMFDAHYIGTVVPEPAAVSLAFAAIGLIAANSLLRRRQGGLLIESLNR